MKQTYDDMTHHRLMWEKYYAPFLKKKEKIDKKVKGLYKYEHGK